jgi:hypothetical protein
MRRDSTETDCEAANRTEFVGLRPMAGVPEHYDKPSGSLRAELICSSITQYRAQWRWPVTLFVLPWLIDCKARR